MLDVGEFISVTACGDDVEHGKPDLRLVGMVLRKIWVPASNALMIGDTPYDAEAALEAGAAAAGVLTGGFALRHSLKQAALPLLMSCGICFPVSNVVNLTI